jgi:hypothetical protein
MPDFAGTTKKLSAELRFYPDRAASENVGRLISIAAMVGNTG